MVDFLASFEKCLSPRLCVHAASGNVPLPFARVHVASLAPDEGFVGFNFTIRAAELFPERLKYIVALAKHTVFCTISVQ